MAPTRRLHLLAVTVTAACTSASPTVRQPAPTPPAPAEPAVADAPATSPAPAPAQQYAEAWPVPAFADPGRRAKLEAAFPAIDRKIEEEMKVRSIPGLAIGVVIDGQLAHAKGFGVRDLASKAPARPDTVYRIGSITKSFTGLALLALRDEGKLAIDDPLVRWIPEAGGLVYPTRDTRPLTLRELMNHTAGLPRMGSYPPETGPSEATILGSLKGLALDRAPGTASVYSNLGFSLLGIAVAHAAGRPYHEVVETRIWKPLGMTSTYWDAAQVPADRRATTHQPSPAGPLPKPDDARLGAGDGAGGIYSTVEDMARYVAFQLDAYPPRNDGDDAPIRRASRREAHGTGILADLRVALATAAAPGEPLVDASAGAYGFGWGRETSCRFDGLVGHGGAIDSHRADVAFLPAYGVGVVVLSNFGMADASGVARVALEELRKTGALAPRVEPLDPAFGPAAEKFLAAYNDWSEAAMVAMHAPDRPPFPEEKAEMAGYKALHGACTASHAIEVISRTRARLGFTCERGAFEVAMDLDPGSRKIVGFVGTSRGVTAPPAIATAAAGVASLVGRWDEKLYRRHLQKAQPPHDTMREAFAGLGRVHGTCRVKAPVHVGFDWTFELDCERGGGMRLTIVTDPTAPAVVKGVGFAPLEDGPCPVR